MGRPRLDIGCINPRPFGALRPGGSDLKGPRDPGRIRKYLAKRHLSAADVVDELAALGYSPAVSNAAEVHLRFGD